jgi:hypothetical protein
MGRTYEPVPGKRLEQALDELLDELEEQHREQLPSVAAPAGTGDPLLLRDRSTSFSVPLSHVTTLSGSKCGRGSGTHSS